MTSLLNVVTGDTAGCRTKGLEIVFQVSKFHNVENVACAVSPV